MNFVTTFFLFHGIPSLPACPPLTPSLSPLACLRIAASAKAGEGKGEGNIPKIKGGRAINGLAPSSCLLT
jgi:hypothetical protein